MQYVLSDKTGTLTQNIMGFVWASIGGHMYGRPPLPPHLAANQAAAAGDPFFSANRISGGGGGGGNVVPAQRFPSGTGNVLSGGVGGVFTRSDSAPPLIPSASRAVELQDGSDTDAHVGVGLVPNQESGRTEHVAQHIPAGTAHTLALDPVLQARLGPYFAELAGWSR